MNIYESPELSKNSVSLKRMIREVQVMPKGVSIAPAHSQTVLFQLQADKARATNILQRILDSQKVSVDVGRTTKIS
jgi:hypothetical protein